MLFGFSSPFVDEVNDVPHLREFLSIIDLQPIKELENKTLRKALSEKLGRMVDETQHRWNQAIAGKLNVGHYRRLNAPEVSCIPAQQYLIKQHVSPRFGETFQVMDVPGRSAVLFHAGNVVGNTQGCIILGQYFGKLKEDRAVMNSGATFTAFMQALAGHDVAHLTITEEY